MRRIGWLTVFRLGALLLLVGSTLLVDVDTSNAQSSSSSQRKRAQQNSNNPNDRSSAVRSTVRGTTQDGPKNPTLNSRKRDGSTNVAPSRSHTRRPGTFGPAADITVVDLNQGVSATDLANAIAGTGISSVSNVSFSGWTGAAGTFA